MIDFSALKTTTEKLIATYLATLAKEPMRLEDLYTTLILNSSPLTSFLVK